MTIINLIRKILLNDLISWPRILN